MTKKHLWIMLACCLIPAAALVAVSVFKVPLGALGTFALILLCPAAHLFMMRGMVHEHKTSEADKPVIKEIEKPG